MGYYSDNGIDKALEINYRWKGELFNLRAFCGEDDYVHRKLNAWEYRTMWWFLVG